MEVIKKMKKKKELTKGNMILMNLVLIFKSNIISNYFLEIRGVSAATAQRYFSYLQSSSSEDTSMDDDNIPE